MILYLSGPMRGYPNFNFPRFFEVAEALRRQGHMILNPAEHDCQVYPDIMEWPGFAAGNTDECPAFNLPDSLAWDFKTIVCDVEGIALLPGWERSSGAKAERFVAEATGRSVWLVKGDLLVEAQHKVMAYPDFKEDAPWVLRSTMKANFATTLSRQRRSAN